MSSIKLKHSGGNAVAISAPASNPTADSTLTLPSTDADGVITTKDSYDSLQAVSGVNGGALSNRNVIINGAMLVNQRSSTDTAVTATGDNQYLTVDRFKWRNYGGSGLASFTQVLGDYPSSEHRFSLKATVTTVNTTEDGFDSSIAYRVEGYDWQRFGWGRSNPKSATISFWAKTSVAGVYSVSMRSGDGTRSQVQETPSLSANTWTKVALTFTGDTNTAWVGSNYATNGAGCLIEWNLGKSNSKNTSTLGSWIAGNKVASDNQVRWIATSGATFFLTGVQVEVGDTATAFEHLSYGDTLAKCQRYFLHYDSSDAPFARYGLGISTSGTTCPTRIEFPVQMRTVPTLTTAGNLSVSSAAAGYAVTGLTLETNTCTKNVGQVIATVSSGLTAHKPYYLESNNNNSSKVQFSAEL